MFLGVMTERKYRIGGWVEEWKVVWTKKIRSPRRYSRYKGEGIKEYTEENKKKRKEKKEKCKIFIYFFIFHYSLILRNGLASFLCCCFFHLPELTSRFTEYRSVQSHFLRHQCLCGALKPFAHLQSVHCKHLPLPGDCRALIVFSSIAAHFTALVLLVLPSSHCTSTATAMQIGREAQRGGRPWQWQGFDANLPFVEFRVQCEAPGAGCSVVGGWPWKKDGVSRDFTVCCWFSSLSNWSEEMICLPCRAPHA